MLQLIVSEPTRVLLGRAVRADVTGIIQSRLHKCVLAGVSPPEPQVPPHRRLPLQIHHPIPPLLCHTIRERCCSPKNGKNQFPAASYRSATVTVCWIRCLLINPGGYDFHLLI